MTTARRTARPSGEQRARVDRFLELRPAVLARMQSLVPADLQAQLGPVTLHQLETLVRLPGPGLTMHELARVLGISGAAACTLADRLVAHGLAAREASPGDRRIVRLVSTEKGRGLVERYRREQRRAVASLFRHLSDDQVVAWLGIMEILAGEEAVAGSRAERELVGAGR